jgi:K+-sensing histidine kinase KdpD
MMRGLKEQAERDQGSQRARVAREQTHKRLMLWSLLLFCLITMGHYLTSPHSVTLHQLYRRLYYLPVVLMAFVGGWRGGLYASLAVALTYAPHAFLMPHHLDPASTGDKASELLLYVLVGLLSGGLVDREREAQRELLEALRARESLEEALVRAAKLSALGQLLTGVSHELRNPLASILGATEGLERQLAHLTLEGEGSVA